MDYEKINEEQQLTNSELLHRIIESFIKDSKDGWGDDCPNRAETLVNKLEDNRMRSFCRQDYNFLKELNFQEKVRALKYFLPIIAENPESKLKIVPNGDRFKDDIKRYRRLKESDTS